MKLLATLAVLVLVATEVAAQGLDARALLGYEQYDSNRVSLSGFRQTYDLHLDRALTGNSHFTIFMRANDFRGDSVTGSISRKTRTRELRPGGEFAIDISDFIAQIRSERFDTRTEDRSGNRLLDRSTATFSWSPPGLPVFRGLADRNTTSAPSSNLQLVDTTIAASANYWWRGISASAEQRLLRSSDERAGYQRDSNLQTYNLGYSTSRFGGKLMLSADSSAQLTHLDESGGSNSPTSVPTPVAISRALWAIDDTPQDSRDHPGAAYPSLIDGILNVSSGISLGPDAASFQNITLDIGHIDRIDEIRIFVRDASNAPLRNGGGPVVWDAYTSEDGNIWTRVDASTTFNTAFSAYFVDFTQRPARWLKVVNFGLNSDATFVTDVQTLYHTNLSAGEHRKGTQSLYSGSTSITWRPWQRLTLSYSGLYTSLDQNLRSMPASSTRDLEHMATFQYDVTKSVAVRGQFIDRNVTDTITSGETASSETAYLDWVPTGRLRVSLEAGRQDETIQSYDSSIITRAIHATGFPLKSVQISIDAGTQTQTIGTDATTATRTFANVSANVQWTRTFRMLFAGNLQRTNTTSSSPAVQLLGPARDNRITTDFIWRPSRELAVSTRLGWVSGVAVSAFTQRVHVDWFPFEGGTLSLGGSYDEDIDATTNRRARRAIFNPHWQVNRFVYFDLNYTTVDTQLDTQHNRQRSLFATVTLIK